MVTKEDLSSEESMTLHAKNLDCLGGIQMYNLTRGQVTFILPSIRHRTPLYLSDAFWLVFELLEVAKDAPMEHRAVWANYCFRYSSLGVSGYILIPEMTKESITNDLRCLTHLWHVRN